MSDIPPKGQPTWDEKYSQDFLRYGRYFVPDREHQMQTIANLLTDTGSSGALFDLGCGEGLLSEAILEKHPEWIVYGLDVSPEMRQHAESRLSRFGKRFHARHFDLYAPSWPRLQEPLLAIVSSLAIHHLSGDGKQELAREVIDLLAPGGAFIVADLIEPAHPSSWELAGREWDKAVRERSLQMDESLAGFNFFDSHRWNCFRYRDPDELDKPSPLFDQLKWLEAAGFSPVDVFWMRAGHAIFGGWKPSRA